MDHSLLSLESNPIGQALYRKLLTLIKSDRTEEEVIHFVVDSLWEEFQEFRISYAQLDQSGKFQILYSRESTAQQNLSGAFINIFDAPKYFAALMSLKLIVTEDYRASEIASPVAELIERFAGVRARIDCPFDEEKGLVGILAISYRDPYEWKPFQWETVREVANLLTLIFREIRARERLKASELMFRQLAENIESVFWISDPKKEKIIYISPAYEKIWGRTQESLYANPTSFLEAIHPEDKPRVAKGVVRQSVEPYEENYRVMRPDGSIRWVKDKAFVLKDEVGKPYRIVGIVNDITEIKMAQLELEKSQAQVVASAKFAALGEMAGGIAHEINNPLAILQGNAFQLREFCHQTNASEERVKTYLDSIDRMIDRIAKIVRGLRTFSRSEKSDKFLVCDISPIFMETIQLCESKMKAKNIKMTISIEEKLLVDCLPASISQILLNLLNNALDAVENAATKWIRVSALRERDLVLLYVEDSGPGVPKDIRDKIFQPFFTTKDIGRGTGLGLSISKGIAEAHGGNLGLAEAGESTKFFLSLPYRGR